MKTIRIADHYRAVCHEQGGIHIERHVTGIGWILDNGFQLAAIQCNSIADNDGVATAGYAVSFVWDTGDGFDYRTEFFSRSTALPTVMKLADLFDIDTTGIMTGRLCWRK